MTSTTDRVQIISKNAGCRLYHLRTRTLGIISRRTGFCLVADRCIPFQPQQFPAGYRTVFGFEPGGKLLHNGIIPRFRLTVFAFHGCHFQSRQLEHAAGRSAGEPHTAYPSTERSGYMQSLFVRKAVQICKSRHNGLRTIITFFEICHCTGNPFLFVFHIISMD